MIILTEVEFCNAIKKEKEKKRLAVLVFKGCIILPKLCIIYQYGYDDKGKQNKEKYNYMLN